MRTTVNLRINRKDTLFGFNNEKNNFRIITEIRKNKKREATMYLSGSFRSKEARAPPQAIFHAEN